MSFQDQSNRHRETVEGGAVSDCGVSAAWMPRPSPMDGFTASPQSDTAPPNPQKTGAVLALALALASSRCRAQPCQPTLPAHENDFTVFSKPSSLRHASTILRSSMRPRATHAKNARPSLRSIQDDIAMAGSWGAATGRTRPRARCNCHCMAIATMSLQIRSIQVVRATSPDQSRREGEMGMKHSTRTHGQDALSLAIALAPPPPSFRPAPPRSRQPPAARRKPPTWTASRSPATATPSKRALSRSATPTPLSK